MSKRREPLSAGGYQRPQQTWQCGLADEGPACPLGPGAGGQCPAAAACRPVRDGDRWHCNRSELRGGPCDDGPGPEGLCAIVYRCTPVRSLRSRRGRFVLGAALAATGAACMALSGPWRNELITPGPLAAAHAQLLTGDRQSLRCAQCHAAGGAAVSAWWAQSTGGAALGPQQAALCLACHAKTISKEVALVAHNAPALLTQDLHGADAANRLRDPAAAIACSACHQEHRGSGHDLTAISDASCQACHREQFDTFADGHPEFASWPYERPTRIAFDHASHSLKHFPTEKQSFDCAMCHDEGAGGRQATREYATSCAGCHDKTIVASLAEGLPLVSLPTVDVDAIEAAGREMGSWPEAAAGDFDGAVPMPATLLVAADPRTAIALSKLQSPVNFLDIDPSNADEVAAAADVAGSVRDLTIELADNGQAALATRLKAVLGRDVTGSELEALSARLSPDVAGAYRDRWFGAAVDASDEPADRAAQRARVPAGGWLRDDATLSLRYHPIGHADPWMRTWLDMLAEAAGGSNQPIAAVAEPMLRAALKPTAPGQCGSCHTLRKERGRLAIQWRPLDPAQETGGFTKFDHRPHVVDPQLANCVACHKVEPQATGGSNIAAGVPSPLSSGFATMAKASCAACHVKAAAGESCTQCHRYHAGSGW